MTLTARVAASFLGMLLVFAGASALAVPMLGEIAASDAAVEQLDTLKHAAHRSATTLREMYVHQAHVVIEGDLSHLEHYPEAARAAASAASELARLLAAHPRSAVAHQVAQAVADVDALFLTEIVPAVLARDGGTIALAHGRLEERVSASAVAIEGLVRGLEVEADAAHEQAQVTARNASTAVLTGLGIAMVLAALVGFSLTRSIVRGVRPLMIATARLSSGDLDARVATVRSDELGRLGGAFNAMAADLRAREDEAVRVRKAVAVAQLAAGVAHEMNNPLGVIRGHATLLLRGPDAAGAVREGLRVIADETEQCSRIVRDLLDLSREPRLVRDRLDLRAAIDLAVGRAGRDLPPGVDLRIDAPGHAVERWADAGRVDQVLRNLIRNAVEACGGQGTVSVALTPDGRVRVSDSGPGIPADHRDRLFDPFFTTKPSGTGLGLAVSAALIEAHGGTLRALPSDSGAVFEVSLP